MRGDFLVFAENLPICSADQGVGDSADRLVRRRTARFGTVIAKDGWC